MLKKKKVFLRAHLFKVWRFLPYPDISQTRTYSPGWGVGVGSQHLGEKAKKLNKSDTCSWGLYFIHS